MKNKTYSFLAILLISTGVLAQEKPVKMSNTGICHAPNTKWIDSDYTAWEEDLKSNPKLTIECLRALKRSRDRGGYGALEEINWRVL